MELFLVWRPGLDFPHEYGIDFDGYMISASYFFKKKTIDLHSHLNYDGTIIVDSGAYTFGKKRNFPPYDRILDLQLSLNGDVFLPLDRPLCFANNKKDVDKFQRETIKANKYWLKKTDQLMKGFYWVIQSTEQSLKLVISKIEHNMVALGGKAIPPTNGKIYSRNLLLEQVSLIRNSIGKEKKLHLLGYSGLTSSLKIGPLIDSLDTLAPQLYAGYRTILTDKPSYRKPKWLKYQSQAFEDVIACPCKICNEEPEKVLEPGSIGEKFRYLHNCWWLSKYYRNNVN